MKKFALLLSLLGLFLSPSIMKADCVSGSVSVVNVTEASVTTQQAQIEALLANYISNFIGVQVTVTITSVTPITNGVAVTMEIGSATTTLTPAEAAQITSALNNPFATFILTNAFRQSGVPGFQNSTVTALNGQILTGVCPSSQPVPTLSEWGLVMLGLVMLNLGAITLYRRRKSVPEVETVKA